MSVLMIISRTNRPLKYLKLRTYGLRLTRSNVVCFVVAPYITAFLAFYDILYNCY
jgi:hypothetical protein